MTNVHALNPFCEAMSTIFEYPFHPDDVQEITANLSCWVQSSRSFCQQQQESLDAFTQFLKGNPLEKIQETYSQTFDLHPTCYLYLGYHLMNEDPYRWIQFAQALTQQYRLCGFTPGYSHPELPDKLPILFRFLSHLTNRAEQMELIQRVFIPGITILKSRLDESSMNPYRIPLQIGLLYLSRLIEGDDIC